MYVNLLVFLVNVSRFEVRGIQFIESHWWVTCFMFCRWGTIADLDFCMYGNLENQDGIDLRVGCEYITSENITGITIRNVCIRGQEDSLDIVFRMDENRIGS